MAASSGSYATVEKTSGTLAHLCHLVAQYCVSCQQELWTCMHFGQNAEHVTTSPRLRGGKLAAPAPSRHVRCGGRLAHHSKIAQSDGCLHHSETAPPISPHPSEPRVPLVSATVPLQPSPIFPSSPIPRLLCGCGAVTAHAYRCVGAWSLHGDLLARQVPACALGRPQVALVGRKPTDS